MSAQKKLTVGVLIDLMASIGTTPEKEYKDHVKDFGELLRPVKLRCYRAMNSGEIRPGTDMVVFDYGGMAGYGSEDLLRGESRTLLKWAQDNPSSLLVVATNFTWHCIVKNELEDLGLNLPNVVVRASLFEDPIPMWFRKRAAPDEKSRKNLSWDVPENLHPIAGLTPLNRDNPLPAMQFFKPLPDFAAWFKEAKGYAHTVYEAGAGMGHASKALAAVSMNVTAVDANARSGSVFPVKIADATDYHFVSNSAVLICRPCHGAFCRAVVQNALFRRASVIVYVGLDKNVDADLGKYRPFFSVSGAGVVGEDGERAWIWGPEWNK